MSYAVVYLNAQGRTIRGVPVVLWETLRPGHVHKYITLRHFIRGLQRVVSPQQLKIATYEQEKAFLGVDAPEPEEPEAECEPDESDSDDDFDEVPSKRRRVA